MMVFDRRSDIIDGKYNTEASFLSPPGMTGADTVFFFLLLRMLLLTLLSPRTSRTESNANIKQE